MEPMKVVLADIVNEAVALKKLFDMKIISSEVRQDGMKLYGALAKFTLKLQFEGYNEMMSGLAKLEEAKKVGNVVDIPPTQEVNQNA